MNSWFSSFFDSISVVGEFLEVFWESEWFAPVCLVFGVMFGVLFIFEFYDML